MPQAIIAPSVKMTKGRVAPLAAEELTKSTAMFVTPVLFPTSVTRLRGLAATRLTQRKEGGKEIVYDARSVFPPNVS